MRQKRMMTYVRPIEMLEHEMRDRLEAKNAEITRLCAELAELKGEDFHDLIRGAVIAAANEIRSDRLGKAHEILSAGAHEAAGLLRATARRDAEEIALLRSNLGHLITLIDKGILPSYQTMSEARAALAPRPPEGKGE
jgi:hypothetical protein